MDRAQDTSNLDSTDVESDLRRKRRKKQIYQNHDNPSDEEEVSGTQCLLTSPPLLQSTPKSSFSEFLEESPTVEPPSLLGGCIQTFSNITPKQNSTSNVIRK